MKIKKILAVALSVATMAISISAFADTATYDADKVSVSAVVDTTAIPTADEQLTVVVVPASFGADTAATAENIYYINQAEAGDEFAAILDDMGLKGELTEGEDYEVRIGGETLDGVVTIGFTVSSGVIEPTYILGNVDMDEKGTIDLFDASLIVDHYMGDIVLEGDAYLAANVVLDEYVDLFDFSKIVDYYMGDITEF